MIDANAIPAIAGAYALSIRLSAPLALGIPRFAGRTLRPGLYIYCGSAHGPGGLRARIARHLRANKTVRWHVDRLTAVGSVEGVATRFGGHECDLVAAFMENDAIVAVPGFGSSDCRRCVAHLLIAPPGFDAGSLAAAVELGPDGKASL